MRLVVIGASGFLGRNVLLVSDPSWTVDAVYRNAGDFPEFVVHAGLAHVILHRRDLSETAQVRELADNLPERVDAITLVQRHPRVCLGTRQGGA